MPLRSRSPHLRVSAFPSALALSIAVALGCALAPRALAAPVINEILFRPGTGYPENTGLEFIELHNPGTSAVNLSGWAFTDGVAYTFPAGTTLAAGGYLVVAANPTLLAASGGYSGAFGPWASGDRLSDDGETITLSQPDGAGGWTTSDTIDYADEGDWATRTRESFGGWTWTTNATAGRSVERRNPNLVVDNGQNWSVSAALGGTPGAANSAVSSNIAPVITEVRHSPAVPKSTEAVTVSCRLIDESAPAALNAILYWRNATATNPATFQTAAMTGDSSGRFTATVPALADKTIIEFYVQASDGSNTRTWPAPTSEGQNANCTYQVDNEVVSGTAPVYRLVLTAAENAAFLAVAPSSDRHFNVTLVASRGADTTIRYRASMRIRGNSSRNYSIKPLRIRLPSDDRWDGVKSFLIGPRGAPWQYLAHKIQRAAGLVAADASPVEVRRQGVESTVGSGGTADYGQLVRVEDFNGDYVDNHWPDARSGHVYRKTAVTSWAYNATAPANPDAVWSGWTKENNSGANDWSDVMAFTNAWQAACAPHFTGETSGHAASGTWDGTGFTDAEMTTLSQYVDFDYLARWLAVMTILPNNEPNLSTGEDDDYAAAFINDGTTTKLFLLPHDMDTTFGTGEQTFAFNSVGLYDATEVDTISRAGAGSVTQMEPLLPLLGNSTTPGNAAFRAKYLTALRELLGSVFDADTSTANPPFYQFVDNHLGEWVPATNRTAVKNFMTLRQAYLLGLIGAAKIPPAAGTGSATKAAASTPTLRLNEVLAWNTGTLANGATFPDVIELHNSGATPIDLAGKRLGDSGAPTGYTFPAGTTLAAGGYLLVYADSATGEPGLHTGFGLDAEGDAVFLSDTVASGGALLDSIEFGYQLADRSIARTAVAAGTWALTTPTLGTVNGNALATAGPDTLKFNEWAGSIRVRTDEDFVELHNGAASPMALGGVRLTDDFLTRPSRYVFPPLSFLGAGGFLVVDTDTLGYGLDGDFETVFLVGENGAVIDRVDFTSQPEDHSTGRTTDGATAWGDFPVPTPGLSNSTSLPAGYAALLANLRLTEVMYRPVAASSAGDYEFVELQNIGTSPLDLGGVRFTNGIDYTFPAGTTLAAGAQIVVCKSRSAFLARYGASSSSVLASGTFSGSLDNSGETLALTLPAPWALHVLRFRYEPTWSTLANASGYSLVVPAPATSAARDWEESYTWSASGAAGGNPGGFTATASSIAITSATLASATVGMAFSYAITASETPTSYGASGLPTGLAVNPSTGAISGTPTTAGSFAVTLSASTASSSANATLTLTVAAAITAGQGATVSTPVGSTPTLSVIATGAGTIAYQWQLLGGGTWYDLTGATSATYTLTTSLSGTYRVMVTANGVATAAATTVVTFTPVAGSDAQFAALSTRALVGSGDAVLVPGFAITGASKRILVRGLGPKLLEYGVTGVLADPQVKVQKLDGTLLASSDNWDSTDAILSASFGQVGLASLTAGSKDAALIVALAPGLYTATVSGVGGATGVGLVEFYDLDIGVGRLAAISTRAQVGTGSNVLIPGVAITGNITKRVVIRAGGPFLTALGVSGALADPKFELKNAGGVTLAASDNWNSADATLSSAIVAVGLTSFAAGSKDAALLVDLVPGTYTIVTSGVGDTSGVALVEVYEVP